MCFRYSHCKPGALRGLPGYNTRLVLTSGDQMMQGNFLSLPSFPSISSYQTEQLKECQTLPGALSFQHLTSFQVLTVFPSAPGSFYLCYSALGPNSKRPAEEMGLMPTFSGVNTSGWTSLVHTLFLPGGQRGFGCHFTQAANSGGSYHLRLLTFPCGRN